LGRANLATRSGRLAEADHWLVKCLTRNPDDLAVWHARLTWALAADRGGEAHTALAHLTADVVSPTEVLDLRAWFPLHQGLREAEQFALERLIDLNPGAAHALERLAVLALESGRTERAAELRRRKAMIDEVKERYRQLLAAESPNADLEELARLAETLGRWFEAWGWYTLAALHRPGHPPLAMR
jgi:tetratricopeptide (TPR) repeat protein